MATYERETVVVAPLARVRTFHSTIEGFLAVTPDWLHPSVEAVSWPGEPPDDGTLVRLSVRPFGVGPRRRWTSEITAREVADDRACFRDEMWSGPLRTWRHTHGFEAVGEWATRLRDRVEYETALGPRADAAARPVLALALADRHRRTRRLLE